MTNVFDLAAISFRALQHRDEIAALWARLQPYVTMIERDYPELMPQAQRLIAEIFPEFQAGVAKEAGLGGFTVHWLQESLNRMGEHLTVDGKYGDATQDAVKRFQLAHDLTIDGWAGLETCSRLFTELAKKAAH